MARPLRIEYPGAFYHVTSRGNERKDIYRSKRDRKNCWNTWHWYRNVMALLSMPTA